MTSPIRADDQDGSDLEGGETAGDEQKVADHEEPSDEEERQYTFGTCTHAQTRQL